MAKKLNICFLSTYPPKKDGVAAYTRSLILALDDTEMFNTSVIAAAGSASNNHSNKVLHLLEQNNRDDYIYTAGLLNNFNLDALVIEHDFGIFGGEHGKYVLDLMNRLKIPAVVTLHTVPQHPDRLEKQIIQKAAARSWRGADHIRRLFKGYLNVKFADLL